ncbi:MAG: PEP-CTERM sorting domain-containing protein [Burkholderiales bacterium]|jgi:hypothetical protein
MKLSKIAAAVALGVASIGAQAAIQGTNPASELLFVAYSDAGQRTFVFDTGLLMTDFLPGSANATSNLTFNLNSQGQSFSSFLSANADTVWGVIAADATGNAASAGSRRTLTTGNLTVAGGFSAIASPWTGFANLNTFITATNQLGSGESTHGSQTNGASSHATVPGGGDNAAFDVAIGSNFFNTIANGLIVGTPSSQLTFASITNAAGGAPVLAQYLQSDGSTAAFWSLDSSTGSLNWTSVAAIPEPSDFAFMVAGLGLAGAIARRRNKKLA